MHHRLVSIDQTSTDELGRERGPTHLEVTVELLTQPSELVTDVASNEPAVPIDRGQRGREDDLGNGSATGA